MNIIQAYRQEKGPLVIAISGLSKSGATIQASIMSTLFGLVHVNQKKYCQLNCHTLKDVDLNLYNTEIDNYKEDGVVTSGFDFRESVFQMVPSYHIHLSIPKQLSLQRRMDKHPDGDADQDKTLMNQVIYPNYLESVQQSKINKFINVAQLSNDELTFKVWKAIIRFLEKRLYGDKYEELGTNLDEISLEQFTKEMKQALTKGIVNELEIVDTDSSIEAPKVDDLTEELMEKAIDEVKDEIEESTDELIRKMEEPDSEEPDSEEPDSEEIESEEIESEETLSDTSDLEDDLPVDDKQDPQAESEDFLYGTSLVPLP